MHLTEVSVFLTLHLIAFQKGHEKVFYILDIEESLEVGIYGVVYAPRHDSEFVIVN